ncbi:MAG: hypothetical protein WC595_04760 [Candidatus Nanoarchaeia archaeon]
MKKAQVEMIGIALLVVVILIGVVFYLRFSLEDASTAPASNVRVTQAYHLVNALVHLPLCEEQTFTEALVACANSGTFCNQEACSYLKRELPLLVNPILHERIGTEYSFEATSNEKGFISFGKCKTGVNSPPFVINDNGRRYEVSFKLCPLDFSSK